MPATKSTESQACKAWLDLLKITHPAVYEHVIKIDNEGATSRANAVRLGLHAGASDYFIAWPTLNHYGAWIEVKRDGWTPTKSNEAQTNRQMAFGQKMQRKGYAFYFCKGIDELIAATNNYLNVKERD